MFNTYKNPNGVYFLMYHDIRPQSSFFPKRYAQPSFLTTEQFNYQLDYIKSQFTPISIADVTAIETHHKFKKPPCVLTFDDGLADHYYHVLPALEKHQVKGTFFIPTHYLNHNQKLMPYHRIQFICASETSSYAEIKHEIFKQLDTFRTTGHQLQSNQQLYETYSQTICHNNHWTADEIFISRFLRNVSTELQEQLLDQLWVTCLPNAPESDIAEHFYLKPWMVEAILDADHAIGGHGSFSHNLEYLDKPQQHHELEKSYQTIQSYQAGDYYFSYPSGGVTPESIDWLQSKAKLALGTEPRTIESQHLYLSRIDAPSKLPKEPRIVLCGIQPQGIAIIDFLKNKHGLNITHVVTISEQEAQQQQAAGWVSYEDCKDWGVEVYHAELYSLNSKNDLAFFQEQQFDILLLGGWQRIISEDILNTLIHGAIGQHGSPDYLSKGRGRSPLNWALLKGNKRLVWNLFKLTTQVDAGDILCFDNIDITPWDTCQTLYYKVETVVKHMYLDIIPKLLNGNITTIPQLQSATFYPKRTPNDGEINWHSSMYAIHNLVRSVTHPYPGAFSFMLSNTCKHDKVENIEKVTQTEKVMIWQGQPFSAQMDYYVTAEYGEVVEVFGNAFLIKCGEGLFLVTESSHLPHVGTIFLSEQPDLPIGLEQETRLMSLI